MDYMNRALSLAQCILGRTSPNPAVGAVIVKDGVVVGEGSTRPAGQAHAEAVALEQAGGAAKDATMYVTLEPCCFQGRTPPCTGALIDAELAEVRIAALDPNLRVSGRGRDQLEQAGLAVHVGELEKESLQLNEAYAKYITTGWPFVTAKFAASLDGKIATRSGESQWITGEEARMCAHHLRGIADAVMVGVNTVLEDDPRLTVRTGPPESDYPQPLRVVVDSRGRTPTESALFVQPGDTVIAVSGIDHETRTGLEAQGAQVAEFPSEDGLVDIDTLLVWLGQRECTHVLVEGGSALLGSFFDRKLVDKVVTFVASAIIGGAESPAAVGGAGAQRMSDVLRLKDLEVKRLGDDIMITGYP